MIELLPNTVLAVAAAAAAATTFAGIGLFSRARLRETSRDRDRVRNQLRSLQMETLQLAREADRCRVAAENATAALQGTGDFAPEARSFEELPVVMPEKAPSVPPHQEVLFPGALDAVQQRERRRQLGCYPLPDQSKAFFHFIK